MRDAVDKTLNTLPSEAETIQTPNASTGVLEPAGTDLPKGTGTAGLETQLGGQPTTVSGVQDATGGMGQQILPEVDQKIFMFERNKNAFMQLMLMAKRVNVKSMEVKHYAMDEETPMVTVASITGNTITLVNSDIGKVRAYDTLMVKGVKGFEFQNGSLVVSRKPLQLFVKTVNADETITCVATNGVKTSDAEEYGNIVSSSDSSASWYSDYQNIGAGTKMVLLSNAMYETQKWVDPNTPVAAPDTLYLQKRGMTSIVSDYFSDQKKEIPYDQAVIAEMQLRNFKNRGNRTLLISQQSKMRVRASTGDSQWLYTTNGVRWQVKRELKHLGKWTPEDLFALVKTYYGGPDKPSTGLLICGENLALALQLIDWSGHPEVTMTPYKNGTLGWDVTRIHTLFGDIQIVTEDVMSDCGFENSGIIMAEDRLVHYVRRGENSYTEKVIGEEATRKGVLISDGLGLKGGAHLWIDGDADDDTAPGAQEFRLWGDDNAPTSNDLEDGVVYVFSNALTLTVTTTSGGSTTTVQTVNVEAGEAYKYSASANSGAGGWSKFYGAVSAE